MIKVMEERNEMTHPKTQHIAKPISLVFQLHLHVFSTSSEILSYEDNEEVSSSEDENGILNLFSDGLLFYYC